jgi:hypothetical protein
LKIGAHSKANARKRVSPASKGTEAETIANVSITHPDRILWSDGGITKLELAKYYVAVAPKLLAQSGNRPIRDFRAAVSCWNSLLRWIASLLRPAIAVPIEAPLTNVIADRSPIRHSCSSSRIERIGSTFLTLR